jgi:pantoate--beta-alanine ligase
VTDAAPRVVSGIAELREAIAGFRAAGQRVGLVPTMGALHAGHLALVKAARREAERVVVTIFVNPSQFAPNEDLARYPRDLDGDLKKLGSLATDLVFVPDVATIYPKGFNTRVAVAGVSEGLCGAMRPHFFGGVATVVTKLLVQAAADVALFGEKDYQQLLVIKRLAADLDIPTRIVGVPTVREADGLALSSRNAYLSAAERRTAPALHATLLEIAKAARAGNSVGDAIDAGFARLRAAGFGKVDYLALCDAESLMPLARLDGEGRVLGAAWLGSTRLIDNVPA